MNFALIATINPYHNLIESAEKFKIDAQLKALFRNISFIEPDIEIIFRVRCMQYSIKSPNILASKLKSLWEMCNDGWMISSAAASSSSPSAIRAQLTISNLMSIVRMMSEQQFNYNPIGNESNTSRPTSYAGGGGGGGGANNTSANTSSKYGSVAKAEVLANQLIPIGELPKKNRLAQANFGKNDHAIFGQMLIDALWSRFDSEDAKVFKKLVQDVFSFKEDSKVIVQATQQNLNALSLNRLESIISAKAQNDYGLFPNKSWVQKCLQIYTLSNTYKCKKRDFFD